MEKRQRKQILLAQNFIKSPALVRRIVEAGTIGPADLVYEIGAGTGILTAELARQAREVVAIEKDPGLCRRLRERFRSTTNVRIVECDFLRFRVPVRDYKIFANIPYNVTADIVRKVLYVPPVPSEAHLIMQREPARKFAGIPRETLFSVSAKPYFEFRIALTLRRTDFEPIPAVESVLLHIRRRRIPLIQNKHAGPYREFVRHGFTGWKKDLRTAYKHVFTYTQWKRLSKDLHFPIDATPTQLTFNQWLGLYHGFRQLVMRE
jgi:23S rRNA (adenine-N6)-dimethyltransferase